jgi:hypothetical protein
LLSYESFHGRQCKDRLHLFVRHFFLTGPSTNVVLPKYTQVKITFDRAVTIPDRMVHSGFDH